MPDNSSFLSEKQRLRIQTRHRVSIDRHGYTSQALFWSSQEIQFIRFEMLVNVLNGYKNSHNSISVLDVGCGFGDLRDFLSQKGFNIDYHGIDLAPDMVRSAGFKYPNIQVNQGEIFDFNFADNQFDFVLLSGALNEVVETEIEGIAHQRGRYAKSVIKEMYRITKIAVAFNLLDARDETLQKRTYDLQSFLPQEIADYCLQFASKVEWCDDYLDNDFTVYLSKSGISE